MCHKESVVFTLFVFTLFCIYKKKCIFVFTLFCIYKESIVNVHGRTEVCSSLRAIPEPPASPSPGNLLDVHVLRPDPLSQN